MGKLTKGQRIPGQLSEYEVVDIVSESGGQGGVYKVKDLHNKFKEPICIKWYWKRDQKQADQIYALYQACQNGTPPTFANGNQYTFVWPMDFLKNHESFGYVMKLLPLNKFINHESIIVSDPAVGIVDLCDVSICLTEAFSKLHASGYCYKDINRDNIFFDLKNKHVYVVDVDNITPNTLSHISNSDVLGTPGFIAPEIIRGEAMPSTNTDRHSLAVILFYLWVKNHPFEGIQAIEYDGNDVMNDIYANPIFIFDKNNKKNTVDIRPSYQPDIFDVVNAWWKCTPQLLKEKFTTAFTVGTSEPKQRVTEQSWIATFRNIKTNGLTSCKKCKSHIAQDAEFCPYCGEKNKNSSLASTCSKCNKKLNVGSHTCPHCNFNNDPAFTIPQIQCASCGKWVVKDSRCSVCGGLTVNAPQPTSHSVNNTQTVKPSPNTNITQTSKVGITKICAYQKDGILIAAIDLVEGKVVKGSDIRCRISNVPVLFKIIKRPETGQWAIQNDSGYGFNYRKKDNRTSVLEADRRIVIENLELITLPGGDVYLTFE